MKAHNKNINHVLSKENMRVVVALIACLCTVLMDFGSAQDLAEIIYYPQENCQGQGGNGNSTIRLPLSSCQVNNSTSYLVACNAQGT